MLAPSQIAQPIRSLVRRFDNITFRQAQAGAIDEARVVAGDLAAVSGMQLPTLAPVAIRQDEHAGRAIAGLARGQPPARVRYRDRGSMATIGGNAAVADLGWVRLSGVAGRVAWLLIRLVRIVSLRSRLAALVNWAWDYMFLRPAGALHPPSTGFQYALHEPERPAFCLS